jgi:hypothetical protein
LQKLQIKKALTRFGPYSRYDPAAASDLRQFFGRKNYAVRHIPDWVSQYAARSWIADQAAKAKTPEQKAVWQNWGVKTADLDDDPATADNVIFCKTPNLCPKVLVVTS